MCVSCLAAVAFGLGAGAAVPFGGGGACVGAGPPWVRAGVPVGAVVAGVGAGLGGVCGAVRFVAWWLVAARFSLPGRCRLCALHGPT